MTPSSELASVTIPGAARRPLSRGKRVAFTLVVLAMLAGFTELVALGSYWYLSGEINVWREMESERSVVSARPSGWGGIVSLVHPYVGFVEVPPRTIGIDTNGKDHVYDVSPFGYIDSAAPFHKRSPNRVIVAVTGGSVACYFAIHGTARLATVLAADSRYAGKELVFVNLALSGYKQPQQLMTLSYLLSLGAEFDVLINLDGFNEVALYELESNGRQLFPAFPRSWMTRVHAADPLLGRLMGKVEYLDVARTGLARRFSRAPWRFSVVCNLLWKAIDLRLQREVVRIKMEFRATEAKPDQYIATGPPAAFADTDDVFRQLVAIWKNGTVQLARLCAANGISYYHFLQPNQYVAGSKPFGPEERAVALRDEHPYRIGVERGYPLLIREGAELPRRGVRFIDLTPVFADHPEAVYVDWCCHLNQHGNDVLADGIGRAILADEPAPRRRVVPTEKP